jgi:hypothetical protein
MTWIVYRVIKDKRCTDGVRWVPVGWVNHTNEAMAKTEAHKMFARYNEENLKLVQTTQGCGWLV